MPESKAKQFTVETVVEEYRIVSPDGDCGEWTDYGFPATVTAGNDVYMAYRDVDDDGNLTTVNAPGCDGVWLVVPQTTVDKDEEDEEDGEDGEDGDGDGDGDGEDGDGDELAESAFVQVQDEDEEDEEDGEDGEDEDDDKEAR